LSTTPSISNEKFLTHIAITSNPFDTSIYGITYPHKIEIFHSKKARIEYVLNIDSSMFPNSTWKNVIFISARTVLVITHAAEFALYYLGLKSDVTICNVSELPPESIVLASNGSTAVYVNKFADNLSPSVASSNLVCIANSPPQSDQSLKLLSFVMADPAKHDYHQHMIQFNNEPVNEMKIKLTKFWASLFGSNVAVKAPETPSPVPIELSFVESIFNFYYLVALEKTFTSSLSIPKFTSLVAISKARLCFGQGMIILDISERNCFGICL
jgi:hypothetical protein